MSATEAAAQMASTGGMRPTKASVAERVANAREDDTAIRRDTLKPRDRPCSLSDIVVSVPREARLPLRWPYPYPYPWPLP